MGQGCPALLQSLTQSRRAHWPWRRAPGLLLDCSLGKPRKEASRQGKAAPQAEAEELQVQGRAQDWPWEWGPQPPTPLPAPTQVDLPHKAIREASSRQKLENALSLIHSAWQRSDSLCRGRASRDPWC